jgi:hypothetical protein
MRVRPFHIWWIGSLFFLPSCLLWGYFSVLCIWKFNQFGSLDWHGFTHVYLPCFAAIFGFCFPLGCLKWLRGLSLRATLTGFGCFVAVMLAWGYFDIKAEHYQVAGLDYPSGVLEDGHRHYWHLYFTWYFLPYRWIHGYQFDA